MTVKIGCPVSVFSITVPSTDDVVVVEIGIVEEGEVFCFVLVFFGSEFEGVRVEEEGYPLLDRRCWETPWLVFVCSWGVCVCSWKRLEKLFLRGERESRGVSTLTKLYI
jgi:hypothetical protein